MELNYSEARRIAEHLIETYKFAEPRQECDEIHMMALYLIGTFSNLRMD